MSNREDLGRLLLRLGLGGILLFHGIFKLSHGVEWIKQPLAALGLPGFLAYGTYVAELVAPILLIVGFLGRLAGLVIAFDLLMAMVLVLRPQLATVKAADGGWAPELEALLLIAGLVVFLIGSGRYRVGRGVWD